MGNSGSVVLLDVRVVLRSMLLILRLHFSSVGLESNQINLIHRSFLRAMYKFNQKFKFYSIRIYKSRRRKFSTTTEPTLQQSNLLTSTKMFANHDSRYRKITKLNKPQKIELKSRSYVIDARA